MDIEWGEFIRLMEGRIEPIACVEKGYAGCSDLYRCVFKKIWQEVAFTTSAIVDTITFEDLANQVRNGKEAYSYQI